MKWAGRLLGTPFGLAVLGCLVLAGWALWSGGILDGPAARQVRSSSVYAAPGVDLDEAAAQRIIGNRRLVVLLLAPGADLRQGCHDVEDAANGTLVLVLSRDGDEFATYGCAQLPGDDDKNIGKAAVAELMISRGVDQYADQPLEALKVIAVNYDLLVRTGSVPDGARTISPSLPRYLIAVAAIVAVLAGTAMLYGAGRRAGRVAVSRRVRRDAAADARSALSAGMAVLAQHIIDLDQRYARANRPQAATRRGGDDRRRAFSRSYRGLVSDYTELLDAIAVPDGDADVAGLAARVESLSRRCDELAASKP